MSPVPGDWHFYLLRMCTSLETPVLQEVAPQALLASLSDHARYARHNHCTLLPTRLLPATLGIIPTQP